ncbi:antitoxin VbhA family protein [Alcaligenes aquatilis]
MSKIKRKTASDAALASVEMEGFTVPRDVRVNAEKFINGEISFPELISNLYEQARLNIEKDEMVREIK